MTWSLMVLPSGCDVNSRVVVVRPVEGATSSVSQRSKNCCIASRMATASGVATSASSSSREATSPQRLAGDELEEPAEAGVQACVSSDVEGHAAHWITCGRRRAAEWRPQVRPGGPRAGRRRRDRHRDAR